MALNLKKIKEEKAEEEKTERPSFIVKVNKSISENQEIEVVSSNFEITDSGDLIFMNDDEIPILVIQKNEWKVFYAAKDYKPIDVKRWKGVSDVNIVEKFVDPIDREVEVLVSLKKEKPEYTSEQLHRLAEALYKKAIKKEEEEKLEELEDPDLEVDPDEFVKFVD